MQEWFYNFFLCLSQGFATDILNKHFRTSATGDPSSWGLGGRLATTHCIAWNVMKHYTGPFTWIDGLFGMT